MIIQNLIEEYINKTLIKNVDCLKKTVELGRSARSISDLRIRQPLTKALYAIDDEQISKFIMENKDIFLMN